MWFHLWQFRWMWDLWHRFEQRKLQKSKPDARKELMTLSRCVRDVKKKKFKCISLLGKASQYGLINLCVKAQLKVKDHIQIDAEGRFSRFLFRFQVRYGRNNKSFRSGLFDLKKEMNFVTKQAKWSIYLCINHMSNSVNHHYIYGFSNG